MFQKRIMEPLTLNEGEWSSLYLKVLPQDLVVDGKIVSTEEDLKYLIEEQLLLGKVERIDFSERKDMKGNVVKSAYIHFFMWNKDCGAKIREMINMTNSAVVNGYISSTGEYREFSGQYHNGVSFGRFLLFKKNINPISKTINNEMNKEQLLNKCTTLEERIEELHKKVENFIIEERSDLIKHIRELETELKTAYEPKSMGELTMKMEELKI